MKNNKPTFLLVTGCAGSGKTTLGKKIAKKLNWTYIDKDTVVNLFTDWILSDKGFLKNNRESKVYCNNIRPLEYKTVFKISEENLKLGNSIVLVIPFIAQISDFGQWEQLCKEFNLNFENVKVKFVWIKHDIEQEYKRIKQRNAERDNYKLTHWEEYEKKIKDISLDKKYNSYIFENNTNNIDDICIDELIKWLNIK